MGAASEHRYAAYASREAEARIAQARNTELEKAKAWRDLITQGHILTFRAACGRIITAGPYQQATGYNPGFALFGLPGFREYHDNAWGIALRVVEYCGRVRPLAVT